MSEFDGHAWGLPCKPSTKVIAGERADRKGKATPIITENCRNTEKGNLGFLFKGERREIETTTFYTRQTAQVGKKSKNRNVRLNRANAFEAGKRLFGWEYQKK